VTSVFALSLAATLACSELAPDLRKHGVRAGNADCKARAVFFSKTVIIDKNKTIVFVLFHKYFCISSVFMSGHIV